MTDETPPTDSDLPYRSRESTFRLFESVLRRAITAVAENTGPLTINPAPLRPTTYAARLRDAMLSMCKYNWKASFTALELTQAGLSVRHNSTYVVLGAKLPRGRQDGESPGIVNPNDRRVNGLPVDRPIDFTEVMAFCILLSAKLLSGPVILRSQTLSPDEVSQLESKFDIAITFNDEQHTIII